MIPVLPKTFMDRMKKQLGEEFDSFLACFSDEEYSGIRVNTGKISVEDFLSKIPFHLSPVPWCENGFYYHKDEHATKHLYYFAGLYYVQEPSAMLPAARLPIEEGDIVLDLCAAPGGKSTELVSRLQGSGLLISNDVSASRAKALVKNLAVWGSANCCITAETPQKLLEQFGCCFDKILVDAPCSGEGMFRKDHSLMEAWEERGPETYIPLQLEILDCAVQMLKPGGLLAYSTCTFSEAEDEETVAAVLLRYPELELVQPELTDGFSSGKAPCEKSIRLWPHKIKGEGHFFALMRKRSALTEAEIQSNQTTESHTKKHTENASLALYSESELRKNHSKIPEEVRDFLQQLPEKFQKSFVFAQLGEQCFLLPPYHLPQKIRYLRTGILLGTFKSKRFEPSQALAMLLDASSFPCVLNLSASDTRVLRYLKGETLELTTEEEAAQKQKGWILICVDGFGLGWGKYVNGSVRNKYYPGWRLQ